MLSAWSISSHTGLPLHLECALKHEIQSLKDICVGNGPIGPRCCVIFLVLLLVSTGRGRWLGAHIGQRRHLPSKRYQIRVLVSEIKQFSHILTVSSAPHTSSSSSMRIATLVRRTCSSMGSRSRYPWHRKECPHLPHRSHLRNNASSVYSCRVPACNTRLLGGIIPGHSQAGPVAKGIHFEVLYGEDLLGKRFHPCKHSECLATLRRASTLEH